MRIRRIYTEQSSLRDECEPFDVSVSSMKFQSHEMVDSFDPMQFEPKNDHV